MRKLTVNKGYMIRLISLILAFALLISTISPVFAQEAANQGSSAPAVNAQAEQTVQTQADQNVQTQADQNVQAQAATNANPADVAPRSVTQENGVEVVRFDYQSAEVNVLVTLKNPDDLPADAVLSVTPVALDDTAQAKVDEQVKTDNRTIQSQKTFDIKFLQNGKEIEPGATVKVTISLPDMPKDAKTEVLHVSDDSQTVENTKAEKAADGKLQLETNSFSRYVIVNIASNPITVNIKRYVYKDANNKNDENVEPIYNSKKTLDGISDNKAKMMVTTDLNENEDKKNYTLDKAVQVDNEGEKTSLTPDKNGKVLINSEKDVTLNLYYQANKQVAREAVTFFDYDVNNDGKGKVKNYGDYDTYLKDTINQDTNYENYNSDDNFRKNGRIAVGDNRTNYVMGIKSQNNYDGNTWTQNADSMVNQPKEQREKFRVAGIVEGLSGFNQDEETGEITNKGVPRYSTVTFKENNQDVSRQICDPGLFTTDEDDQKLYNERKIQAPRVGKHIITDYQLKFDQDGDHYKLVDVVDKETGNTTFSQPTYNVGGPGYNFFPLDKVPYPIVGHEKCANGDKKDHNDYFGMRYDIKFKLGDYVGDLNYNFRGDDDMWVVMDGQQVVIDLGGIHTALSHNLDLWKVLAAEKGITDPDNTQKKEFEDFKNNNSSLRDDQVNNKWHTLTVLYMERGAGRSNCVMDFKIPNAVIDEVTPVDHASKGTLQFKKVSQEINESTSVESVQPLEGAEFSMKKVGDTSTPKIAMSDSTGTVTFNNIEPSNDVYEIKEVSAPLGYIVNEDITYYAKATMTEEGVKVDGLYTDRGCTTLLNEDGANDGKTVINYPIEPFLDKKKTVNLWDWDDRTYLINLKVGQHVPRLDKMKDATITDVIDPRFEIIDKETEKPLKEGEYINKDGVQCNEGEDGAGKIGTTEDKAGNKCYLVRWENQEIPALLKEDGTKNDLDASSWYKNIYIRAKNEYVGGNNVTTNVDPGSNILVNGRIIPFAQPKVNVKPRLYINDLTKTVFAGDTIYHNDSESKMFNVSATTADGSTTGVAQCDMIGDKYTSITNTANIYSDTNQNGKLRIAWCAPPEGGQIKKPETTSEKTSVDTNMETQYYLKAAYTFEQYDDNARNRSIGKKPGCEDEKTGRKEGHYAGEEDNTASGSSTGGNSTPQNNDTTTPLANGDNGDSNPPQPDQDTVSTQGLGNLGQFYILAKNSGNLIRNDVFLKEGAKDHEGQPYGVYTVHVVKGQIQITKNITEQYSQTKAINANQTFVFRIDQYEVNDPTDPNSNAYELVKQGGIKKTFYETIAFSANDQSENKATKTKLISNLPRGIYVVTEETDWSPKYTLSGVSLKDGAVGTGEADLNTKSVQLNIGARCDIDNKGVPTFTGVECYKYANSQDRNSIIPYASSDDKYIYLKDVDGKAHYSANREAASNFVNMINGSWKWLSDTAAAVNQFTN